MTLDEFAVINEMFLAEAVTPAELDRLLADGWRHFGPCFFRYNVGLYEDDVRRVIPLRVRLADFAPSKSQRRVLRRNADLEMAIRPVKVGADTVQLFGAHRQRFKSGVPTSLDEFLGPDPAQGPTTVLELEVRRAGDLVAASFFDIGETSISSIYGIFDPRETSRSLGILTMLKEIEFAVAHGMTLYYHGYVYEGESCYDYKKRFRAIEAYDWRARWEPLSGR